MALMESTAVGYKEQYGIQEYEKVGRISVRYAVSIGFNFFCEHVHTILWYQGKQIKEIQILDPTTYIIKFHDYPSIDITPDEMVEIQINPHKHKDN